MTEQRPQHKKYIITSDEVEWIDANAMCRASDAAKLCLMIETILDRPAPALTAISEDTEVELSCDSEFGYVNICNQEKCIKQREQAAAQAREKVLKDVSEQIERTYSKSGVMNVFDLLEWINSLRHNSNPAMEGCEDDMEQEAQR